MNHRYASDDLVLPSGAYVESPLVVRVAGLPSGSLGRLRFEESFARATELVVLRDRLRDTGDALSKSLYLVIGSLAQHKRKSALVGLRRALHQIRMPSNREWNEEIAAVLPGQLADRVQLWMSELGKYQTLHDALPDVLAGETLAKHTVLREIAGHPNFRRALSTASPALFDELGKWLDEERRRPQKQSLVRLAKYVARAAGKTSPYSTFTVSGVGRWVPQGPAQRFTAPHSARTIVELDGLLLRSLSKALCGIPPVSEALLVRANPSATVLDNSVSFVGPPPREPIVTVSATPAVLACLRLLKDGGQLTMGQLRDRLAAGNADAEKAWRFLCALAEIGLLERQLPVADQSPDPLGELSAWLANSGNSGLVEIATLVRHVRGPVQAIIPIDDVGGHRTRVRALGHAVNALAVRIGLATDFVGGWVKGGSRESAVFAQPAIECATPSWRPALEDLDVVRRWLAVFDPTLPMSLALGAFCGEQFGIGSRVPLLMLHRALQEELLHAGSRAPGAAVHDIARLLHAPQLAFGDTLQDSAFPRQRELALMRCKARQVAKGRADEDGVVRIESATIDDLASSWPIWVKPLRSLGYYVQVIADAAVVRLVINMAHGGYGRGRSRVLHLIQQAGGRVPAFDSLDGTPGGPLLAELGGLFDSTLNMRVKATPYEIDYPFTVSARPISQQIPLADLEIIHEPQSGQVRLGSMQRKAEVYPLHLGMMADMLLPPVARLISQSFGTNYYLHPGIPLLTSYGSLGPAQEITSSPRIELGRVVLQRARWIAPTDCVPVHKKGEPDATYLVRLLAWLREHKIPARCFVRVLADDPRGEPDLRWEQTWIFDKSHKPVYIDFANWYLVMVFERMLAKAGHITVFEEVLPLPEDSAGPDPINPSATEFLIEICERDNYSV